MFFLLYALAVVAAIFAALFLWTLAFVLWAIWQIVRALLYVSAVYVGRRRARRRLANPPAINADA